MQEALISQHNVRPDDAVRTDLAVCAYLRFWIDDRSGMNGGHDQESRMMKATSASLTTLPLTEQRPLALPILPRDLVSSTSIIRTSPGFTGVRHFTFSADMK